MKKPMHLKKKEAIKNHLLVFFNVAATSDDIIRNQSVSNAADEVHKDNKQYISQLEVQFVISDIIKKAITEKRVDYTSEENTDIAFTSMFSAEELDSLADKIIDYFDSFPRKYTCVFKLPNVISSRQFTVPIDANISFECNEPMRAAGLLSGLIGGVSEYTLSIVIKHSGYLSFLNYSSPYGVFKQLVGIATAFDYFESNAFRAAMLSRGLFGNSRVQLNSGSYFFDDEFGDQSKIFMNFSDSVDEKLHELEFNNKIVTNHESCINHIREIYTSFSNDKAHAARVCSALEWSYDAKFTNNNTFTFILNCIAIEALMGERGTVILKTLGNRCAYLLGKTTKDRKYIIDSMEKLYDLRSDLVHGDKSRLSDKDNEILFFASGLIRMIIKKELSILLNSRS